MFEKIIKITSRIIAAVVVFMLADGFYLSQKGFQLLDGNIVLVKAAQASDTEKEPVDTSSFTVEAQHVLGNKNAPVTIYEFSSLGCTHCADFHLELLPQLKKDFIDSGKVKVVFVDFPIDKKSMQAAMLARCMPEDKYFDFLSVLFKKQLAWGMSFKTEKLLSGYAEIEGMSPEKATACMNDNEVAAEIMYNRQQAMEKLGLQATPSFLIRDAGGDIMFTGVPDYAKLSELLNKKISD